MDHAAADGRDDAPLILIVDDERDIADMLDSYFRLEGYRTIVAHDAAGALAAAPSRVPPSPSGGGKGRGGHLGLGLYVSRLLAEKHDGGLEVANGPGGGAIARATLAAPVAQGNPESN